MGIDIISTRDQHGLEWSFNLYQIAIDSFKMNFVTIKLSSGDHDMQGHYGGLEKVDA